jgi:ribonuclease HII
VGEIMICGIDEAGRGPIAGPLVVAGVILKENIKGLNDSKKLTAKKREELFEEIIQKSEYKIVEVSNYLIDEKGLSWAINFCLNEIVNSLDANRYIFDGNSKFGVEILETMVKGDSKVAQISAASILAKVTRDRYMIDIASRYPNYSFKKHKGYITKQHIEEIRKFGYSDIHRKSYKLKSLQRSLF